MDYQRRSWRRSGWWSVVLLLVHLKHEGTYACSSEESAALLSLKGNNTSSVFDSWKPSTNCCNDWEGVICGPDNRNVIRVDLPTLGQDETRTKVAFSSQVCNLKKLQYLSIHGSEMVGYLPPCLWNLTDLEYLDLSGSGNIGGVLPTSSNFANGAGRLWWLDLSRMRISGPLPEWIGSLSRLEYLDVSENQFNGSIPKSLGELRTLQYLMLSNNRFSGSIPATLSDLTVLKSLYLDDNNLTGRIPSELGLISTLYDFSVANNRLTGPIPTGGYFNTSSEIDYENNPGLCGFPLQKCLPAVSPARGPADICHSFKCSVADWVSLSAFLTGFEVTFAAISVTFALSHTARSYLYVPRREAKVLYLDQRPYGAYMPKT